MLPALKLLDTGRVVKRVHRERTIYVLIIIAVCKILRFHTGYYFAGVAVHRKGVWRLPIEISGGSSLKHAITGVAIPVWQQLLL